MLISQLGLSQGKKKKPVNPVLDFIASQKNPPKPNTKPVDTRTIAQKIADPAYMSANFPQTPSPTPDVIPVKKKGTPPTPRQQVMVAGKMVTVKSDDGKPFSDAELRDAQISILRQEHPELAKTYDVLTQRIASMPDGFPGRSDAVIQRNNLLSTGKADVSKPSDSSETPNNPIQNLSDSMDRGLDKLDSLTKTAYIPQLGGTVNQTTNSMSDMGKKAISALDLGDSTDPAALLVKMLASGLDIKSIPGNELLTDPAKFKSDWAQNSADFAVDPSLGNYAKGVSQLAAPGVTLASMLGGLGQTAGVEGFGLPGKLGKKLGGSGMLFNPEETGKGLIGALKGQPSGRNPFAHLTYNDAVKAQIEADIAARKLQKGGFNPQSAYSDYQVTGEPNLLGIASQNPKPFNPTRYGANGTPAPNIIESKTGFNPNIDPNYPKGTPDGPLQNLLKSASEHPDVKYPNWRQRTEGVIAAIDKTIAEGVGSNKKKGLLNLKSDLAKSIREGRPHQGIIDEYPKVEPTPTAANQYDFSRAEASTPQVTDMTSSGYSGRGRNKFAPPEALSTSTQYADMIHEGRKWTGRDVNGNLVYKETHPDGVMFGVNHRDSAIHFGAFDSEAAAMEAADRISKIQGYKSYDPELWMNGGNDPISTQIKAILEDAKSKDVANHVSDLPNNTPDGTPVNQKPKNKFAPPETTATEASTSGGSSDTGQTIKTPQNESSRNLGSNNTDIPTEANDGMTGIANRHTEAVSPVDRHRASISAEEAEGVGHKLIDSGQTNPYELVNDLIKTPRNTSDVENGVLRAHMRNLKDTEAYLDAQLEHASITGNHELEVSLQHKKDDLVKQMTNLRKATVYSGSEWHATGRTRQGDIPINEASEADALSALNDMYERANQKPSKAVIESTKKASKKVRDANRRLVEAEAKESEAVANEQFAKDASEARKDARSAKKAELDSEFADLEKQAAKHLGQMNTGIPVELAPIIAKMVRNRISRSAITLAEAIEPVFLALQKHYPGLTRRDVMDAYSGYGKPESVTVVSPKQVETQLAGAIKSQARAESLLEDAKKGIFQPKKTKVPAYTKEVEEARKAAKLAAQQARDLRYKNEPKTAGKKVAEAGRTMVMTSFNVFGKLAGATIGHSVITPAEEIIAPLLKKILPGAGTEATASIKAEGKALEQFLNRPNSSPELSRTTLKDTLEKLKTGYNEIDLEARARGITHGENQYNGLLNILHNAHGAMKTPLQRASFAREYEKVLESYIKKGVPVNEAARADAFERAYLKSKEAILMNDSTASKLVDQFFNLKVTTKAGRTIQPLQGLKYIAPVVRVPINYVGRTLEYTHGLEYAAFKALKEALVSTEKSGKGLGKIFGKIPPSEQQAIARAIKRGGVGAGLMAIGAFMPKEYFSVNDEGSMVINGHPMPNAMSHIPWLEAIKMGALWRDGGFIHSSFDTIKDVAKHSPAQNIYYDYEGLLGQNSREDKAAQTAARIAFPGAGGLDQIQSVIETGIPFLGIPGIGGTGKKAPQDWLQEFMQHIPILRQLYVPDK